MKWSCKTLLLIFVIFSNLAFSQSKSDVLARKRMDSLFTKKKEELTVDFQEMVNKANEKFDAYQNKQRYNDIKDENGFWKDRAFWQVTILGGLLALTPLLFWIIEIVKARTISKIAKLEKEIRSSQSVIKEYRTFQFYQEYYFEHVLKPTIGTITDKLVELSNAKTKLTDDEISEISNQFYDFERVIDLIHYNPKKREVAKRYIESRQSKFLRVKMNTIVDEIDNPQTKTVFLELLRKYEGNGN